MENQVHGNRCFGKKGADLVLKVPKGTVIKDFETGKIICDLSQDNQKELVLRGGKGGKGNVHFATSTRQVPDFAIDGEKGKEVEVVLELKSIADVGLVGFPNAGKSTLLSVVTAATPKIADYPFTTIDPNLGVVKTKSGESFIIADIPGIIEGASEGIGLGLKFLRHVERTRLLLHVIDVSGLNGRKAVQDFEQINNELEKYSDKLINKKQIVVANKIDIMQDRSELEELKKKAKEKNFDEEEGRKIKEGEKGLSEQRILCILIGYHLTQNRKGERHEKKRTRPAADGRAGSIADDPSRHGSPAGTGDEFYRCAGGNLVL